MSIMICQNTCVIFIMSIEELEPIGQNIMLFTPSESEGEKNINLHKNVADLF